ncbi:MAG: hypothetical protein AAFN07_12685 [Pseudomonadota bacterium]
MNTTTSNDARIEHVVSLELERRARSRKIIWALLALALVVAVMIMIYGNRERDAIRMEVRSDTEFASSVAMAVARENSFLNEVAASEPIRKIASEQVEAFVQTDAFANSVASSPEVRGQIERASRSALSGEVLQDAVKAAVSELPDTNATTVMRNSEAIESLEQRWQSRQAPANVVARLDEIETLLQRNSVEDALRAQRRIEALETRIGELDSALQQSQQKIRTLEREAARIRTDGAPRSYLLREKTTTSLAGTGLSVTLGPKTRDGSTSIQVTDRTGRVVFDQAGIGLGETFEFSDSDGQTYTGALPYSQSRFLAKDYLGLELDRTNDSQ